MHVAAGSAFPWSDIVPASQGFAPAAPHRDTLAGEAERLLTAPPQKCAVAGSASSAAVFLLTEIISGRIEPASLLATRTFLLGLSVSACCCSAAPFFPQLPDDATLGAILN
jgi:hypothetical protein